MTERLLHDYVRTGHNKKCRAQRTKTYQKRRLQTLSQCNGASITYPVVLEPYLGDGLVYLVLFQPALARAWLYACFAERLRSCAVCGRHTWTSARKRQLRVRLSFLLLLWRCLCHAVRVKRCATRPWHGMPGAVYLHVCRARGHVLRCRGVSCWKSCLQSTSVISHTTTCHSHPTSPVAPQTFSVHRVSRCPSQKPEPHQGFRCHS